MSRLRPNDDSQGDRPVRPISHDLAAAADGGPQAPFGIDGGAVSDASARHGIGELSPVRDHGGVQGGTGQLKGARSHQTPASLLSQP